MDFLPFVLVAAAIFGVCFLFDKGFTRIFRGTAQHLSGRSIRANKHYGGIGTVLIAIGIGALLSGLAGEWVLLVGGSIVLLLGMALVVYYLSFGIYYDDDSFVYSSFGRKSLTFRYEEICAQQVYVVQGGNIMVELHMASEKAIQVQLQFQNAEDFLNTAFLGWVRQKNLDMREGDWSFHDPDNSCWFPKVEER